ncbi:MAG: hypothetical protein WCK70_03390 [Chloroflexales bacterium]|jgi:hypothetical protein
MANRRRDQEFRLPKITYIDYKVINMDRVLTRLFPRLKYDGWDSRRAARRGELELKDFIATFQKRDRVIVEAARTVLDNPSWSTQFQTREQIQGIWFPHMSDEQRQLVKELLLDTRMVRERLNDIWFEGLFAEPAAETIIASWIETDLMDVVNRGKPKQAIAAPRPLHGNTYKFRNANHSRDYNASEEIYWMLFYARRGLGQGARDALRTFFFPGVNKVTDAYDSRAQLDVETQALLRLDQQVSGDTKDSKTPERFPPLCLGVADLLADDVLRLLAYQSYVPRIVLVEYLKILFAFHLALYHLRLLKLLPEWVRTRGADASCGQHGCPLSESDIRPCGDCKYQIALVVDMGGAGNTHMTTLARRSADLHYRRIPEYIQAHFAVKKLDEMADYLAHTSRAPVPAAGFFSVRDLLQMLQTPYSAERDAYFKARLVGLVEDSDAVSDRDPQVERITALGLSDFETFIEILVTRRGAFHRDYITQCLDSLLLKNSDSGLLRQPRGSVRAFSMGSRLLEVLLQLAVLTQRGASFTTRELSVEDLLTFLRLRYGLYIDRLPEFDGFTTPSILDRQALRKNVEAFKTRLREIGFFEDLSDAYITQAVKSRYQIDSVVAATPDREERS